MAEREILAMTPPPEGQDLWYFEGNSPVVDEVEGGGTWFCFEEPFVNGVVLLFGLGFTMPEVYAAWSKGVGHEAEEA